jgi:hypothetical protein
MEMDMPTATYPKVGKIPPIAGPYHLTMKVMDPPQYGVTVYL